MLDSQNLRDGLYINKKKIFNIRIEANKERKK